MVSTKELFIKNTLSLIGSQTVIKAFSFVLGIFLARYLGATDYGIYSFGYAYFGLFGPFAGLGLNLLIVREAARKREEAPALVGTSMLLKCISSCITIVIAFIILQFIPNTNQTAKMVVYIFGLAFILDNICGSLQMGYAAYERFDIFAIIQFVERIVSFTLILALLLFGYRLIAIAIVRPVTAVIILITSTVIACKKIFKTRLSIQRNLFSFFLRQGWPFMADALFAIVYLQIDKVMLQALKGPTSVGWYAIASGFLFVFIPFQMAALQSAFPIFSRNFKDDKQTFSLYYGRLSRFLFSTGIVIALVVTLFSTSIIVLLYGKEYIQSILMIRIVIWALPLMSLTSLARTVLISCNMQKTPMIVGGISILLSIMLNYLLIPVYGGRGAAGAMLITQLTSVIIFLGIIAKKLDFIKVLDGLRPLTINDFSSFKTIFFKRGARETKADALQSE